MEVFFGESSFESRKKCSGSIFAWEYICFGSPVDQITHYLVRLVQTSVDSFQPVQTQLIISGTEQE